MTVTAEVSCPKCGGKMWDNTVTKTNPKAPDFKCRDRACDGVIWPPKNGAAPRAAAAPAAAARTVKQPISLGTTPFDDEETGAAPAPAPAAAGGLPALVSLYRRCLDTAVAITAETDALASAEGVSPVVVASVTATIFIEANKRGIK
jgi:hypothetical protein